MPILGNLFNRNQNQATAAPGTVGPARGFFGRRLRQTPAEEAARANIYHIDQFQNQYGGAFDPAIARATGGADLYAGALGVNGPEGTAAARGAFQTSPGYEFARDEGLNAALRGASAAGMLASGNTLDELQRRGTGYADQSYQQWLGNLFPFVGEERMGQENRVGIGSAITQGRMGINTDIANAQQSQIDRRRAVLGNLLRFGANLIGRGIGRRGAGGGDGYGAYG